ncbi:four helix bundle protein [candidate division KSB1 bacterium]|nr:four helix bundle protein [candidate division KSB1 bacterium]
MASKVESYHDLIVWQKSHALAIELFRTKFSKKESESLATKIRETAADVAQTIAIGFHRRGRKPKLYYYRLSLTAVQELEYQLLLASDLGLLKNYATLEEERESIERMLKRLIQSNSPAMDRQ